MVKVEAPVPPYVTAALQRKTIPYWVMPVLLFLPIWAIYYVGYLERPPADPEGLLFEGGEVYAEVCASCHGGTGSGGTGRQLNGGEVLLTFPSDAAGYDGLAGHIAWVANGSDQTEITEGPQYGDPARIGNDSPRTVGSFGAAMGNFTESLTVEELAAVVYYERVAHGDLEDETARHELEVLEEFVHLNEEAGVSNLALGYQWPRLVPSLTRLAPQSPPPTTRSPPVKRPTIWELSATQGRSPATIFQQNYAREIGGYRNH